MILHIPHSATAFPEWAAADVPPSDIALMTDWFTEELFAYPAHTSRIFGFSRFACDVERLEDDPLGAIGQGILYTKLTDGRVFRTLDERQQAGLMALYHQWHKRLRNEASQSLSLFPRVVVVDCHSYSGIQLGQDEAGLPDVCIGVNESSNAQLNELVTQVREVFHANNYSTAVNHPYGGAVTPFSDPNMYSLMIEVNKRIYLTSDLQKSAGFVHAKAAIQAALAVIEAFEDRG